VAVNAQGLPVRLAISGGQVHDSKMMFAFLDWQKPPLAIIADKAYGSAQIRQAINDEGALDVIPAKSNARDLKPHDETLYKARNIVERFFCKMKDMRRLATRFEKSGRNFLNLVYLFAIKCWSN
jgi:transposase